MERLLNNLPENSDNISISKISDNSVNCYPYMVSSNLLSNKNIYELTNFHYADDVSDGVLKNSAGDYDSSIAIVLVYIDSNKRIHEIGNSEILFDSLFDFIKNNEGRITTTRNGTNSFSGDTGDVTWSL